MKKIILFTDCLGAGGAQRQLVGLAIMLKDAGYDVTVATYFDMDFYKNQLDNVGVRNILIPNADNGKKRIGIVRSFFKKESPDWVIAYQETPSLVACLAKVTGCKFRLIVSERNTTQTIGMNERVRFFLYRWADAIVPNSYAQEEFLSTHYAWMKCKIKTITNFVDLEHFGYVDRKRRDVPEIVVAASIWGSKNTIGFIETVRILAEKGYKFHVSWYGKTENNICYFNKCVKKIEGWHLHNFIELKEKTKRIKQVYQDADYFCLPSFYEGTPNVICEAISTGLPVICSNVCDNHIYVQAGINGFLFEPHNSEDMAIKISEALNLSEQDYSTFGYNSRTIAENKLSEDKFANSYIEIIES